MWYSNGGFELGFEWEGEGEGEKSNAETRRVVEPEFRGGAREGNAR